MRVWENVRKAKLKKPQPIKARALTIHQERRYLGVAQRKFGKNIIHFKYLDLNIDN